MDARLLSKVGRAFQAPGSVSLYGFALCAVQLDKQSNHNIARPGRWMQATSKLMLPVTREVITGNLSLEHVRHKYKRPGCRI